MVIVEGNGGRIGVESEREGQGAALRGTGRVRMASQAAARRLAGCLAILLSMAADAGAQKPKVETFAVGDGLPSAAVSDLARDPSGRLWILSQAGLTLYDGHAFVAAEAAGLPDGELGALEVDDAGRVWTMTRFRGPRVYRLDDHRWRPLPAPDPGDSPGHELTCLAVISGAAGSTVAVGSPSGGLWLWDGAAWALRGVASGLPSATVAALAAFDGAIAVGTGAGLCFAEGHELDCRIQDREPRLAEPILGFEVVPGDSSPRLWILAEDWLGHLEDGRLRIVADGLHLPWLATTRGSLLVDPVGGIYFGVQQRLMFLDPETSRIGETGLAEGLATDGVTSLLLDRESNVWVSSLRGLSKIESRRFLSFDEASGLLEDEVTTIVETAPGHFVLGHNIGLTFLDDRVATDQGAETLFFARTPSTPIDAFRVTDMALDRDGTVWLAAHQMGLLRIGRDRTLEVRSPAPRIYSVERDAHGRLWACSQDTLFVDDGSGFSPVDHGQGDVGNLRWLAAGEDGSLYVSTARGLLWHDGEAWRRARGPTSEADLLYGLLPEPSGEVWVGTRAGLYRLRDGALVEVDDGGLRVERPVYFILQDRRGRTWFGSDDGVRIWDGRVLRQLSVRHGMAGWETNRGAGFVDHRGRVWIGTDRGVSMYQERYDTPPAVAPVVEIRAVEIGGVRRPLDRDLELSHRQNTLVFHVDTLAFSREEEVRYRYRLDGFDPAWQGPSALPPAGIRYTNVPPGRYRFRIAVGWAAGPWSDEVTSAAISIARPFWRTPWFYALVAAVLTAAGLGGHGIRTRVIRSRNKELEALTARLNESLAEREHLIGDLEDKNRELERFTYTVSHDLKSPLVTIKGFLGLLEKDAAAGDVERTRRDVERISAAAGTMGRLLDELLDLSRIGRVVNEPTEVPFAELAREAVASAAGQIAARSVAVEIAADLPAVHGDRVRLLEVLQNLVENATKFMGEEPAPRIEIGMRRDGPQPVFYVEDNGIGIDPRYHDKVFGLFERLDQSIDGTGVGLTLVQRIVEVHGGRIWVESEGVGRGTTFCFTLPGDA